VLVESHFVTGHGHLKRKLTGRDSPTYQPSLKHRIRLPSHRCCSHRILLLWSHPVLLLNVAYYSPLNRCSLRFLSHRYSTFRLLSSALVPLLNERINPPVRSPLLLPLRSEILSHFVLLHALFGPFLHRLVVLRARTLCVPFAPISFSCPALSPALHTALTRSLHIIVVLGLQLSFHHTLMRSLILLQPDDLQVPSFESIYHLP